MTKITKSYCQQLDKKDPLAHLRQEFYLPKGKINMDGNSLGSLPKITKKHLQKVIQKEWGDGMITSWSNAGWFNSPISVGYKIAKLIGAKEGEVLVTDTTSINIYKALCAAISLNKGRKIMPLIPKMG